jgi:hypothetical protein
MNQKKIKYKKNHWRKKMARKSASAITNNGSATGIASRFIDAEEASIPAAKVTVGLAARVDRFKAYIQSQTGKMPTHDRTMSVLLDMALENKEFTTWESNISEIKSKRAEVDIDLTQSKPNPESQPKPVVESKTFSMDASGNGKDSYLKV